MLVQLSMYTVGCSDITLRKRDLVSSDHGCIHCPFLSPSEVWLGEYQGQKVAIKMLKDLKDSKASQQFLAEASIMT